MEREGGGVVEEVLGLKERSEEVVADGDRDG